MKKIFFGKDYLLNKFFFLQLKEICYEYKNRKMSDLILFMIVHSNIRYCPE